MGNEDYWTEMSYYVYCYQSMKDRLYTEEPEVWEEENDCQNMD